MITIEPLVKIGEHERGATFTLVNERKGEFIFGTRKKGSLNGQHYHKGIEKVKDPEVFFLLTGEVLINLKQTETGEQAQVRASAPCKILFPKMVWHEVEALTDISFMECNSIEEHARDTHSLLKILE